MLSTTWLCTDRLCTDRMQSNNGCCSSCTIAVCYRQRCSQPTPWERLRVTTCDKIAQPTKSRCGIATPHYIHHPSLGRAMLTGGSPPAKVKGPRPVHPAAFLPGSPITSQTTRRVSPLEGRGRDVQIVGDWQQLMHFLCFNYLFTSFLKRLCSRSRRAYDCVTRLAMVGKILTDAIPARGAKQNPGREENEKDRLRMWLASFTQYS